MQRGINGSGRGGNRVGLGKHSYTAYRHKAGYYDDRGKYVEGGWERYNLVANVQGALIWSRIANKDSGEVMKQTLSLRTNQAMRPARTDVEGNLLKADRLLYSNALWELQDIIPYRNLAMTAHDEVLLVRLDESPNDLVPIGECCDRD